MQWQRESLTGGTAEIQISSGLASGAQRALKGFLYRVLVESHPFRWASLVGRGRALDTSLDLMTCSHVCLLH